MCGMLTLVCVHIAMYVCIPCVCMCMRMCGCVWMGGQVWVDGWVGVHVSLHMHAYMHIHKVAIGYHAWMHMTWNTCTAG